jgi:hypothetical protein
MKKDLLLQKGGSLLFSEFVGEVMATGNLLCTVKATALAVIPTWGDF